MLELEENKHKLQDIKEKISSIADALNISAPRARAVLSRLLSEDIIIGEGANRNRTYRLKS